MTEQLYELEALVDVKCAFLFEPEISNYSKILAVRDTFQTKKLLILPVALSNETKVLSFDGNRGELQDLSRRSGICVFVIFIA